MTSQKKRKSMEFSKIILVVASLTNIVVMGFACYMIWLTQDLTPLPYLITAVATEVGTGRAFYYNKAKTENLVKLQYIYKDLPILNNLMGEHNNNNEREGAVG